MERYLNFENVDLLNNNRDVIFSARVLVSWSCPAYSPKDDVACTIAGGAMQGCPGLDLAYCLTAS